MSDLKLTPINDQSSLILQKKDFAFIGISPFSSYFSVNKITDILNLAINNFDDFAIFIPDKISKFTLEALNYKEGINQKIRKQDNYLKNKAKLSLEMVGDNDPSKIINLSSLLNNKEYLHSYSVVMDKFNNNELFMQGCLRTTESILSSHSKAENLKIDTNSLMIGVQYFLKELPLFLSSPEILNVSSCCFIYPSTPEFLEDIYSNFSNVVSREQGFVRCE